MKHLYYAILNSGNDIMTTTLNIDKTQIAAFCERWHIQELDLFGSALRDDFGPQSDLDFLVVYAPGATISLFDEAQMEIELEAMFERSVDLVSKCAVESSSNWVRRDAILESMEPIYVAS